MRQKESRRYAFGPFVVDADDRLLLRAGAAVALTPKVFDLLLILVENSGHVLEKDELIQRIWPDSFVEEGNLNRNISTLRKALGENADDCQFIETLPKRGYRFIAPVREVQNESGEHNYPTQDSAAPPVADKKALLEDDSRAGTTDRPGSSAAVEGAKMRAFASFSARHWLVALLIISLAAAGIFLWLSGRLGGMAANGRIRTIAVLPFKLVVGKSGDEYLGLGMADALITRLGNVRQVAVRPTSAVRKYGNAGQDAISAGSDLRVDAVLDGSIQRIDDRIRVTVQLFRVQDGAPLWSDKFDERASDMLAVEDSISEKVASALTLRLSSEAKKLLKKRPTENSEAYQSYLRGRYFWNKRTVEGHTTAIQYFQDAISKDPNFAQAYAGLADSYALLGSWANNVLPRKEAMPKAKEAALHALQLDEGLAEAHTSLAFVLMHYDWSWAEAEKEFKRALELNPSYPTAHHWDSIYLVARGQREKALEEMKRALEVDPTSLIINNDLGEIYYFSRQYDRAIDQYRKTLEMDPTFVAGHMDLGAAYLDKRMHPEAIAEYRQAVALSPGNIEIECYLAGAYAYAEQREEARKVLARTLQLANHREDLAYPIAHLYARMGGKEEALRWLEKARQNRSGALILLNVEPAWDPLRSDPRFLELLRQVGLAS